MPSPKATSESNDEVERGDHQDGEAREERISSAEAQSMEERSSEEWEDRCYHTPEEIVTSEDTR